MRPKSPRVAVRAVIVHNHRLLMVNAWPCGQSALLCAPGGGVEPGASLPDNLIREIHEETGLHIHVGAPCLINEFHDPGSGFHQIEIFFRCTIDGDPTIKKDWRDPENIVSEHYWLDEADLADRVFKPSSLARVAFGAEDVLLYDPLELLVQ